MYFLFFLLFKNPPSLTMGSKEAPLYSAAERQLMQLKATLSTLGESSSGEQMRQSQPDNEMRQSQPDDEYKKVILLLRKELGKARAEVSSARAEVQELKQAGGITPRLDAENLASSLQTQLNEALGKISQLEAQNIVLVDERSALARRSQLLDKDCSVMRNAIIEGLKSGQGVIIPEQALTDSLAQPGESNGSF
jgi:hypothetical protein